MAETLHITNELGQLALLDGFLGEAATAYQLSGRLLMDLKLALEEAVTNIILYAYPGETGKDISITLSHENSHITVTVADTGVAFNPLVKQEPDLSLPLEERPIGGLGIYLVKQLMTDVQYLRSDNKNILTMTKNIH